MQFIRGVVAMDSAYALVCVAIADEVGFAAACSAGDFDTALLNKRGGAAGG